MGYPRKHNRRARIAILAAFSPFSVSFVLAQAPSAGVDAANPPQQANPPAQANPAEPSQLPQPPAQRNQRIMGVIPNYQTVQNPQRKIEPLTVKQKFALFVRETVDPYTAVSAAAGAALSQADNDHPKYGQGAGPYAERFGAAVADITTQNFFADAALASVLHEDPRYFRKGEQFGFWNRVGYALSRVAVTRTDAGASSFNYSRVLGVGMGITVSNVYYPASSVNATEVATHFGTSLAAAALNNILPEFWPDISRNVFHRKPRGSTAAPPRKP